MKTKKIWMGLVLLCLSASSALAQKAVPERPRILISTDIGGTDPDDNQSMAHLLMYSNEFDIEGLVSSPSYGKGSTKEIFRMIGLYEQQLPIFQQHGKNWPAPDYLRSITKQGRHGAAPYQGFDKPTEGSEWIVKCARKESSLPLYVLVWGGLEDVAQALHDAPDIASRIRIYWIGGPNKKWSINSYAYIVDNFPKLWFIENNATYRGFIYDSKNKDQYNGGYYEHYIKGAGLMGDDFAHYYKGNPKLGDTPSLLYMMDGDPANPEKESWGGSFVKFNHSTRVQFQSTTTAQDTVPVYSIMEFHLKGPKLKGSDKKDLAIGTPCITLTIDRQQWEGYYMGKGKYMVRYSTYKPGTHPYTITSTTLPDFNPLEGAITISNVWPGKPHKTDYMLQGGNWYTDHQEPSTYWHNCQGAQLQQKWRNEIMEDWGKRWNWLK